MQSCFVLGVFNILYAIIKFFNYSVINSSLYLGLILVAISFSGLKIIEMREREKMGKDK